MVRHKIDPGVTTEQEKGDAAHYEYIIRKPYHSSSRQNIYHQLNVFIDDIIT
jgi:hypothetical protein